MTPSEKACQAIIDIALSMISRMQRELPSDAVATTMLVDAIGRMMMEAEAGLNPDGDPHGFLRARAIGQMDQLATAWLRGEI